VGIGSTRGLIVLDEIIVTKRWNNRDVVILPNLLFDITHDGSHVIVYCGSILLAHVWEHIGIIDLSLLNYHTMTV
jgi:hypothetical protein